MWGVVGRGSFVAGREGLRKEFGHCAFSAEEVEECEVGRWYA